MFLNESHIMDAMEMALMSYTFFISMYRFICALCVGGHVLCAPPHNDNNNETHQKSNEIDGLILEDVFIFGI